MQFPGCWLINVTFTSPKRLVQLCFGALTVACVFGVSGASGTSAQTPLADTPTPQSELQIVQGDILAHRPGRGNFSTRAVAATRRSLVWPDGIVPYRIDPALSASRIRQLDIAIKRWNSVANISLVPAELMEPMHAMDHVVFQPGTGCASWIGRQGGAQAVWIAPDCGAGSIMHEIGHVLGLEHEHTRPDRDQFIAINWQNIKPEKVPDFKRNESAVVALGDYDYGSIMHYGPRYFSHNGKSTIVALDSDGSVMGQRSWPSDGDIAAIARRYSTDLSVVAEQHTTDTNDVSINAIVTNHHDQGAHEISLRLTIGEQPVTVSSAEDWTCSVIGAQLLCELDRLPGGATSALVIELDNSIEQSAFHVSLQSRTADSDLSNNGDLSAFSNTQAPVLAEARGPLYSDEPADNTVAGSSYSVPLLLLLAYWRRRSLINR